MCRVCCNFVVIVTILSLVALCPMTAMASKPDKGAKADKGIKGTVAEKVPKANAGFDANKMSDMSEYDPAHWVSPTGDTIKIGAMNSYSGPGAINGQLHLAAIQWAVHDINKRGGIFVDEKKKLVQIIRADHMAKADQSKKVAERMILQEKVHVLIGSPGSNMVKIMNEVGGTYKIPVWNYAEMSDDLYDAANFNRYCSQGLTLPNRSVAVLLILSVKFEKKEKKFYILNKD